MPVLVFDIETIPDVAGIRAIENRPRPVRLRGRGVAFQQRRASHGNDSCRTICSAWWRFLRAARRAFPVFSL